MAASAATPEASQAPDADLLEFLGTWNTGDGRWVDPFHTAEWPGTEAAAPQKDQRAGPSQARPQTNQRENRNGPDHPESRPIDPMREMTP